MRAGAALGGVVALLAIAGCALDRSPIADRPGPTDTGVHELDAGVDPIDARTADDDGGVPADAVAPEDAPPAPVDATMPPRDVGPGDGGPRDGGPIDGGACTPRCEGATVVACSAPIDCTQAGAGCGSGPMGSAICVGGACGGAPICSPDATAVLSCPGGVPAAPMPCARGCEGGACRPMVACGRTTDGSITPGGTLRVALCGMGNDHDHDDRWLSGPCAYPADGEDALIRLTIDRGGRFRIEVQDSSGGNRVDPVVYVRQACEDGETEVGCHDDISGSDLDSDLRVDLAAGEYFVVVDSVDQSPTSTDCGDVDLSVSRL